MRSAARLGSEAAKAALSRRTDVGVLAAAATGSPRTILAEGDSWFDYPLYDVIDQLEARGHTVEAVAHAGDTLESMAYDTRQTDGLVRAFRRLRHRGLKPDAILLSGGGNDVAGDALALLLNHAQSGLPAINEPLAQEMIDERLRRALCHLIGLSQSLAKETFGQAPPILVHGYGYPVPDDRGFMGGFWFLPGPWLAPAFRRRGYETAADASGAGGLAANTTVMVDLITRFNDMVADVATCLKGVRYVDLRPLLSNEVGADVYKKDWGNELHPTRGGFRRVTDAIERALG